MYAFGSDREFQQTLSYGLPLRSMAVTGQTNRYGAGEIPPRTLVWSIPESWRDDRHADLRQFFPCRPIWRGFAINTVFYAGVLWLLFAAPSALRRRRRIKRGLCPQCAYDLRGSVGGSQQCPECGATK
jgi:hypothetical protein